MVVPNSTKSSNDDGNSPQTRAEMRPAGGGGLSFAPETPELSDTCTSFGFNIESSSVHCLQPPCLDANEEFDGHLSCQLNLTLASLHGELSNTAVVAPPATQQARVNDVFWEQFLTERPGSLDGEDAGSNFRSTPLNEQEDRR